MAAAATAYCTSNTTFHQNSLTTSRSQFSPSSRRATSSPTTSFSSPAPITPPKQSSIIQTIASDENNNKHQIEDIAVLDADKPFLTTKNDNDTNNIDAGDSIIDSAFDEEEFLSYVGLRPKMKIPILPKRTLPPLTKRFACPVCLLPLPKYGERARQALYIRLPFLKFLKTTSDIERYCSTNGNARAQSLLPRSTTQKRALSAIHKSPRKHKLPKTELINMATNTLRNKTTMSKYIQSVLQCSVALDRLEQSEIDQIIQNSPDDDDEHIPIPSTTNPSSSDRNATTTDKRKSPTVDLHQSKRFKSIENEPIIIEDNHPNPELLSSTYQRIYLKCFVCSKRQFVYPPTTNSDVLHSHWREHDGNLSLNIYDSELDSILTRVVEFFHLPRQHLLEGKIQTVFIYNSKEIRCTSTTTLSSNDSYIVID